MISAAAAAWRDEMADFDPAFNRTLGNEGGYANDSMDRGGETYRGIARVSHPDWVGWSRIDAAKSDASFPTVLSGDSTLQQLVRDFYRAEFWDVMAGDAIPSQRVAEEMFDTGVNMGVRVAVKFLQRALNVLNRDGALYPDREVDGQMGPLTMRNFDTLTKRDANVEKLLLRILDGLQCVRYVEIMENNHGQERFARGWILQRIGA